MSLFQSLAVVKGQNGKAFASGTLVPADEDVQVVTGLGVVEHCGGSMAGVPTLAGHMYSSFLPGTADGDIQILSYKPTAADNAAPAASSTEVAVAWWAVGTL